MRVAVEPRLLHVSVQGLPAGFDEVNCPGEEPARMYIDTGLGQGSVESGHVYSPLPPITVHVPMKPDDPGLPEEASLPVAPLGHVTVLLVVHLAGAEPPFELLEQPTVMNTQPKKSARTNRMIVSKCQACAGLPRCTPQKPPELARATSTRHRPAQLLMFMQPEGCGCVFVRHRFASTISTRDVHSHLRSSLRAFDRSLSRQRA